MSQDNALARVHNATSLLCFALPSVGMMLFMGLYTLADTACVSRLAGTDALAALNIVCPVINVTVGLGSMLASGGCALISRSMGEGNMPLARQNLTMIILFGTALGVLLSVSGLWQLDAIVVALGASARLFPLCRAYLGVLLAFMPAGILQTLYTNLFAAAGRPGLGMALSAAAGALNVALDILLMTTGHMGIAGAALGTGLGYLLPAAAGTVFFARGRNALRFARPAWRPRSLTLSMANGASELVGQLACAVTTVLFNLSMMRLLGEDGVAAITASIYAQFLLNTAFIGFSIGVAPLIGYRYGAGDAQGLLRLIALCLRLVFLTGASIFIFSRLFGARLVGLLIPVNTRVHALAADGFRLFCISFLFGGINIFSSALFTAISNGRTSALLAFLRTFLFSGCSIPLLARLLGATGVFIAIPAAEGLALLCSAACLSRLFRRLHRVARQSGGS